MNDASAQRRWLWLLAALLLLALFICTLAGFDSHSFSGFAYSFLYCGLPAWGGIAVLVILANFGARSRKLCGYCGYDRAGLEPTTPCPECGCDGTSTNAPGHRPVGRRPLPIWVWVPAVIALPATIATVALMNGAGADLLVPAGLLVVPACFLIGVWHAWRQAG